MILLVNPVLFLGSILITIVAWILSGIFGTEAEEES